MRVVVVGAGITGLVAARGLSAAGADVVVLDRGRSVGGRMATRRIGDARVDHGAQFFTVRTPAFRSQVDDWIERGLVRVWTHGFGDDDGDPRYIASAGMNSLPKDLAGGLDIETSTMAFAVRPGDVDRDGDGGRWHVVIDDGTRRHADAVVITCPLPQAFALVVDTGVDFDDRVFRVDYDRTLCLLAVLDRPPAIPPPGAVQAADETFSFIGDNTAKGISSVPAVTFHAGPQWSEDHWDDERDDARRLLELAAAPWLGEARIVESQLKRWRFATPRTIWPDPCWVGGDGTIVVAGDAFSGPRVEGAHNSGLAAAHALTG